MPEDIVKITSAAYRLLDYLPDFDPLKNKAKEKALAILENATLEDIEILERYLALAKLQGWIGGMNFLIVKKYYEELKPEIKKPVKSEPVKIKPVGLAYSPRQKAILQLLENQEKVQVADIIKKIPNVTKRTVRRDMDELLKKGAVVRMGEFNQIFYQRAGT